MRKAFYVYILILCGIPSLSYAEQPLEALRRGIDEAIKILVDQQYAEPTRKKLQQQKLWEVTRKIFDFEEFSRRVLASYWKNFTPGQSKEFVDVFGEFLSKFYLRKLQEKYSDESVIYLRQEMIDESKARVDIKVLWRDLEVPVEIRMKKRRGSWKAYDLNVLGVSAVKNYRAQFKMLLSNESPQQVIDKLKLKIAQLDGKS
jgi:phospholipid transport system substrate-binding protein